MYLAVFCLLTFLFFFSQFFFLVRSLLCISRIWFWKLDLSHSRCSIMLSVETLYPFKSKCFFDVLYISLFRKSYFDVYAFWQIIVFVQRFYHSYTVFQCFFVAFKHIRTCSHMVLMYVQCYQCTLLYSVHSVSSMHSTLFFYSSEWSLLFCELCFTFINPTVQYNVWLWFMLALAFQKG